MRRLFVILTAILMLAVLAAPATAKPGKPDKPEKPGPVLTFGAEPYAEYQPDIGMCVADVGVDIAYAGKGNLVVFEASREDAVLGRVVFQHSEIELNGSLNGLLFSYEFPCGSEIELEITHTATLYRRKGTELVSITETRFMDFLIYEP